MMSSKVRNRRPVYIIHPFRGSGNDYAENLAKVQAICDAIVKAEPNVLPICPVLCFGFMDDTVPDQRKLALEMCHNLMTIVADCYGEAWVFGEHWLSEGCTAEIELAKQLGMEVMVF